jgi:hypothetical protein
MRWITGANYEEYIDSKSMARKSFSFNIILFSNSWKLDVRGLDSFIMVRLRVSIMLE